MLDYGHNLIIEDSLVMETLLYMNLTALDVKLVTGQLKEGSLDVYVNENGNVLGCLNDYVFLSKQYALQFLTREYDYWKREYKNSDSESGKHSAVTMMSRTLAMSLAVQVLEF